MQETDFYQLLLSPPDLVVEKVELSPRRITLRCHVITSQHSCPHCLQPTAQVNQYTQRQVRDLDMSGRQVWLVVGVRQFFCPDCDRYFTERLRFADPGKSHTHRQAKWIFDCCGKQPFTEVGALLGVNAKTVERIYYYHVNTHLRAEVVFKSDTQRILCAPSSLLFKGRPSSLSHKRTRSFWENYTIQLRKAWLSEPHSLQ